MIAMTYTSARQNLAETMDRVCEDCAPVTITRSGSQQQWSWYLSRSTAAEETAHLLRSPANARRLVSAVESLAQGKGKVRKLKLSE